MVKGEQEFVVGFTCENEFVVGFTGENEFVLGLQVRMSSLQGKGEKEFVVGEKGQNDDFAFLTIIH